MSRIRFIGFDGDDTLWHNETIFVAIERKFRELLEAHSSGEDVSARLYATEKRNLARFGYGAKGFVLSMIETAIEIAGPSITGREVQTILAFLGEILDHPLHVIEGVSETLEELARAFQLVLITKGELLHQELKIARSGLANHFSYIRIVSEKDCTTYKNLFSVLDASPSEFVMVGNSLRSDVQPAVESGAFAIHVPYRVTWQHEEAGFGVPFSARWLRATSVSEVPDLVRQLQIRATDTLAGIRT